LSATDLVHVIACSAAGILSVCCEGESKPFACPRIDPLLWPGSRRTPVSGRAGLAGDHQGPAGGCFSTTNLCRGRILLAAAALVDGLGIWRGGSPPLSSAIAARSADFPRARRSIFAHFAVLEAEAGQLRGSWLVVISSHAIWPCTTGATFQPQGFGPALGRRVSASAVETSPHELGVLKRAGSFRHRAQQMKDGAIGRDGLGFRGNGDVATWRCDGRRIQKHTWPRASGPVSEPSRSAAQTMPRRRQARRPRRDLAWWKAAIAVLGNRDSGAGRRQPPAPSQGNGDNYRCRVIAAGLGRRCRWAAP